MYLADAAEDWLGFGGDGQPHENFGKPGGRFGERSGRIIVGCVGLGVLGRRRGGLAGLSDDDIPHMRFTRLGGKLAVLDWISRGQVGLG